MFPVSLTNLTVFTHAVKLVGVTTPRADLTTYPTVLNANLTTAGFFTKPNAEVTIVSNVNYFREHALGILLGVLGVSFFTLLFMLYLTGSLC